MSIVKSFAVGHGDMFYIYHNSDNFSIIDCCLSEENRDAIVEELSGLAADKGLRRFISTHPDEDHLRGLQHLDTTMGVHNFYCVKNNAFKEDESDDFLYYCQLRDAPKTFHIHRGCTRRWMNQTTEERGTAGIQVIWPDTNNNYFTEALQLAEEGGSPNNISSVLQYKLEEGARFLWFGDLETTFMENIADAIVWPTADVIFASHHGRQSGKIPDTILDQVKPRIIVLGEAPSRHLHYYGDYHTLTQNSAGDLTFDCISGKVHIYASEPNYAVDFLDNEGLASDYYIGTLTL